MAKCLQCGRQLSPLTFRKRLCPWCVQHEAAQRGEIAEDAVQRVMPTPWVRTGTGRTVTQGIFGINVAVFLGMALAGVSRLAGGALMGTLIARFAPARDAFLKRLATITLSSAIVLGAGFWLYQARGFDARVSRANQLLANQPEKAIAELKKIIQTRPTFVPAHFALAHAYSNLKQYDQAESELKRVLELQPQYPWASYELGMTLINERRIPEAKQLFNNRIAKNPKDADAHYGMGMVLAEELNYAAAIQEYSATVRLEPDFEGVYYEIGNLYTKLKKYDDAITAFQKERQQNGDDQYVETGLADAYKGKGMTAQSQEAESKAEQLRKSEDQD